MMKDIFIGVDGGGSKTQLRIEDDGGHLIAEYRGGPAQIRVSPQQAWQSIINGLRTVLNQKSISLDDKSYRFHAGLALAGTEFPASVKDFLSRPHPFASLSLKSDAHAACLGAHEGKSGSIIIIGTGVKGLQIEDGKVSEVAGWGFPQDDVGAGAWLGLHAVRSTLRSIDGRDPSSGLAQAILDHFDGDLSALLNWSISATSTMYATLAPIVIEHFNKKDPQAQQIMLHGVKAIDEVGDALFRKQKSQDKGLPCSLFGGLVPFIQPLLSPALQERIVVRRHGPAKGAIFMIKQEMGKTCQSA